MFEMVHGILVLPASLAFDAAVASGVPVRSLASALTPDKVWVR